MFIYLLYVYLYLLIEVILYLLFNLINKVAQLKM
jgi:hypothetical protein